MPNCVRCGRILSSKQALEKHTKSRSCVEVARVENKKLCDEAYAVLRCSPGGIISDCDKKSPSYFTPPVKMFSVAGKSLYEILSCEHDPCCCVACKYTFSTKHIQLLSNPGTKYRVDGVRVQDVISGTERKYDCVIAMDGNEMCVHLHVTT